MKNNLTSLIFILFLILIIMLIIMNIQKEPEKFTPSDYENITSNIITNVDNPVNCFDACDKNPDCDGVSLVKNKETNNYDCVLGLKNLSIFDMDQKTSETPLIYQKRRRRDRPEIVVYDDNYPSFYPTYNYYPQSMTPLYYPYWWRGGRNNWRDGRFAGFTSDQNRRSIQPSLPSQPKSEMLSNGKPRGEMLGNGGMDDNREELPGIGGMQVGRDEITDSVTARRGKR